MELALRLRFPVVALSRAAPAATVAVPITGLPPVLLMVPLPPAVRLIEPEVASTPSAVLELPVLTLLASARLPAVVPRVMLPVVPAPPALPMPMMPATVPTVKPSASFCRVMLLPRPLAIATLPSAVLASVRSTAPAASIARFLLPVMPPAVPEGSRVQSPIDNFVLAAQVQQKLKANGPATKEKLIRRAYFDLIGLPPSAEQIDAFVNDASPQAFEKVIDELLASQHYGEKWARHWLDVARFAESGGYEFDGFRPGAYHYRDWVIRSLNNDCKPTTITRRRRAAFSSRGLIRDRSRRRRSKGFATTNSTTC